MAIAKLYNLARVITTTVGTGTINLGSAVPGALTFADAGVQDGDVVSYGIKDSTASEVGRGTYSSSGPTLTRTTVLKSTNGDSAINLTGNNAEVFITALAEDFDFAGNLAGGFWPSSDVASSSTCDIGATTTPVVRITGTTTITSFGTATNKVRRVRFAGALTLTYNGTSLVLPGLANITTAPGDEAEFASDSSGNWKCTKYQRASGLPVIDNQGGAPSQPQGRLTLTSGTAVTTSDVTGATTIYYTPVSGLNVPLYDGTKTKMVSIGSERSLALDNNSGDAGYHQSGKIFDLFVFNDSGTIRLGSGPAWSSSTSRGTGAGTSELEQKNGFLVNKNSIVLRWGASSGNTTTVPADQALYVGSFYATGDGQASDTKIKRLLFNAYNQAPRTIRVADSTSTWTYSTAAFRQSNANAANQFEVLDGFGTNSVDCKAVTFVVNSTTTPRLCVAGIGIDSNGVNSALSFLIPVANNFTGLSAFYNGVPGLGYHQLRWLEYGGGGDTQTWSGVGAVTGCGLTGEVVM